MKKLFPTILICSIAGIVSLSLTLFRGAPDNPEKKATSRDLLRSNGDTTSPKSKPPTTQSKLPHQKIDLTSLPEHIQLIAQEYWHKPEWSVAMKLTRADKDILIRLYRQEPSLAKKKSLTVALGLIGDEEVVDLFKHALSDEYTGRKLTSGTAETDEELVMNTTVSVMGFLANKSDSAYDLLKKGMEPKFWKEYCKFIPANDPGLYGTLAGDSIRAIGRSGRPDVSNILESLKPLPLVNDLDKSIMQRSFEGSVFDAAFADDIIRQRGMDFYKPLYFNLDACIQTMQGWEKQGIGLEWNKWYQKKKME